MISCVMMMDISDDLPLPRPPFATTLSMSGFLVARHKSWKCLGINSDRLSDVVIELHRRIRFDLLFIRPHHITLT